MSTDLLLKCVGIVLKKGGYTDIDNANRVIQMLFEALEDLNFRMKGLEK